MSLIYLKTLPYEERAVYGVCVVCGAQPGHPCKSISGEADAPADEFTDTGAHVARLINAPRIVSASSGPFFPGITICAKELHEEQDRHGFVFCHWCGIPLGLDTRLKNPYIFLPKYPKGD